MIKQAKPTISRSDLVRVLDYMANDLVGFQEVRREFERNLSKYLGGNRGVVCVHNAQMALYVLLRYLGVQPGDEIILSVYVQSEIWELVRYFDLKPVFVDLKPQSYCMDVDQIPSLLSEKTKVVLISHHYGYVNPTVSLTADKSRSYVLIEDCSHCFGSEREKGEKVGFDGDFAYYSFDVHALISTLDGGAIVAKKNGELEGLRELLEERNIQSPNARLSLYLGDLNSAMGLSQLELSSRILKKKKEIGQYYQDCMGANNRCFIQPEEGFDYLYNYFPIRTEAPLTVVRDLFKNKKVEAYQLIKGDYFQKIGYNAPGDMKYVNGVEAFKRTLLVPIYPLLQGGEVELIGKILSTLS